MISVICTQCRARLEMDDAFAGGVCRCQYCGTIQTVPSLSKIKRQTSPLGSAPPAGATVAAPVAPRPQASNTPPHEPSGLDVLAEAVASSSGLGRGSLRSGASAVGAHASSPAPPSAGPVPATAAPVEYATPARQKKRPVWLIAAGAAIAALLLVALGGALFSTRAVVNTTPGTTTGPGPGNGGPRGNDGGDGEIVAVPATPQFCGIGLEGEPSVVYLLDRGAAAADMFDTLKEAAFRSLESLKPDQKFAMIFWSNGGEEARYPDQGLADARPGEINQARKKFGEVYAGGRADPQEAIKAAAALKPSAIVLVTGKALDDDVVKTTQEAVGGGGVKVHTVSLGDDDIKVLKEISTSTGGQTRVVTKRELRSFSE